ncbi:MAG TPA: hypothetical protein VF678_12875, partial [bacterium]
GNDTSAPPKASGSGYLSDTPMASALAASGTYGGVPVSDTVIVFVDDSTGTPKMWRGDTCSGGQCLSAVDPLFLGGYPGLQNEGSTSAPIVLSLGVTHNGSVALNGNSYYVITGLTNGTPYVITVSNKTDDDVMTVWRNTTFTNPDLCNSTATGTADEVCFASANATGAFGIRVHASSGTSSTYSITVSP